ncbi:MAG: hypothetical protein H0T18_03830 [Chloroflexia bacterium]|nr:hypothetical protein [Chloroflexia bacterium]
MANRPTPIRVTTETDLPTVLDDATKGPLLLERDEELFRLAREDDIAYEPDPVLVGRTLAATAGSWADLDVDKTIADVYEARRKGSRSPERP